MYCGKEMTLSFHYEIFFVHYQISKILIVFVLDWGAINKTTYAFKKRISYFDVIIYNGFQECIDSSSIMSHMIAEHENEALLISFASGFKQYKRKGWIVT